MVVRQVYRGAPLMVLKRGLGDWLLFFSNLRHDLRKA